MDTQSQLTHSLIALIDGGSLVAVVVGVAKAFEWFDGMVSDAGRQALSNQLRSVPSDERIDSWGTVFPRLIDTVFGPRPLSWTFFLRSCIASLIAVFVTSVFAIRFHWLEWSSDIRLTLTGVIAAASVVSNLLPDYVSLLISRTIVRMMNNRPNATHVSLLLILDTVLTWALAVVSALFGLFAISAISWYVDNPSQPFSLTGLSQAWKNDVISTLYGPPDWLGLTTLYRHIVTVFFISAFFTSIWVWLYVLSIFIIKAIHKIRTIWVIVTPYLDIEKKPLVAIGKVAGLLAGVGYTVILGVAWVGHRWR